MAGMVDFGATAPETNGFNSGLMGGGLDIGNVLGALGQSLLTSTRQNPLANFGTALQQADARSEKKLERQAVILALRKAGLSEEDATALSLSPLAAKLAVDAQATTRGDEAARKASSIMSGQTGGDTSAPSLQPRMTPSAPAGPAEGVSLNGTGAEIQTKFVDNLKAGGLTNPYGLAAVAAYGQHESKYDPKNVNGQWSDPSESGQPGTSGGILSWRGERLDKMRTATQGAKDPVAAQAQFTLQENPELTARLQAAKSPEEANALMAEAWKFAGYNRPGGGEYDARLATTRSYADRFSGAGNQAPVRVASADPLAGFVPTPGGGAGNPDPGAARAGAPVLPPAGPSSPLGRPVQVANNETETQVLEGRMNMLPRDTYGITPNPASPPGAGLGRPMVAQADLPAPGAQPVGFRIPPGANGETIPPEERTIFTDKSTAFSQLGRISKALAVPNLPDATRRSLEAERAQAMEILKPTDQTRRLMDAGYQPGTQEFKDAARRLTFGEKDDKEKIVADARQREKLAEEYGFKRGTPEFANWVLAGKLPRDETKPLSVADRSAILKADEAAEASRAVLGTLKDAMALSKKAYEGPTASYRGMLTGTFGNEAGQATTEYDNLVTQNALGQLKATFGAAPTEGERKILLEIQGSSSQPDALRQKLLARAYSAAERRIAVMDERGAQLREGDYYKPNRGQGGQRAQQGQGQAEQAPAPAFNPSDIVDRKTVGGKTYARTSDGRVFEVAP